MDNAGTEVFVSGEDDTGVLVDPSEIPALTPELQAAEDARLAAEAAKREEEELREKARTDPIANLQVQILDKQRAKEEMAIHVADMEAQQQSLQLLLATYQSLGMDGAGTLSPNLNESLGTGSAPEVENFAPGFDEPGA